MNYLVTLQCNGQTYNVPFAAREEYEIRATFERGSLACDCQRSLLIRGRVDRNFELRGCGRMIRVTGVRLR